MEQQTCNCGRTLPLTRPLNREVPPGIEESAIRTMVDAFYDRVRAHETLGPLFAGLITDWEAHMPKMYAFWSSAVLRTGQYSGRPIEVHIGLPGVDASHYRLWIDLWEEVVNEHMPPEAASIFVDLAMRMGKVMTEQYGADAD